MSDDCKPFLYVRADGHSIMAWMHDDGYVTFADDEDDDSIHEWRRAWFAEAASWSRTT